MFWHVSAASATRPLRADVDAPAPGGALETSFCRSTRAVWTAELQISQTPMRRLNDAWSLSCARAASFARTSASVWLAKKPLGTSDGTYASALCDIAGGNHVSV